MWFSWAAEVWTHQAGLFINGRDWVLMSLAAILTPFVFSESCYICTMCHNSVKSAAEVTFPLVVDIECFILDTSLELHILLA